MGQVRMTSATHLARRLAELAPVFCARPEQVVFLSSPAQYYDCITQSIAAAQARVALASLYLGKKDLEAALLAVLRDKLAERGAAEFKARVHMDYLRGTRDFPAACSASLLCPLVAAHPSRLSVSMYLTPSLHHTGWRSVLVPSRWNEVFGLSHLKVCVFDDNVLITGANFSKSYFTDRVDRYVLIKNHPQLADYFDDLLTTIGKFSFTLSPEQQGPPKALKFSSPAAPIAQAESLIKDFIARSSAASSKDTPSADGSVFLVPSLQMAPHNVRQDELVLEATVSWVDQNRSSSHVSLATGYFNLAPRIQRIFAQATGILSPWRVLTSSPQANSFFGSEGVSRYIPDTYRAIELAFLQNAAARPRLATTSGGQEGLYEYSRPGWSFHAKGLWIDAQPCRQGEKSLAVTVIGSSNFGSRSCDRDLEAQLTIITEDSELVARIQADRDAPFGSAALVSAADIEADTLPSYFVRMSAYLLKSFL